VARETGKAVVGRAAADRILVARMPHPLGH
jgi:hypothetical protein